MKNLGTLIVLGFAIAFVVVAGVLMLRSQHDRPAPTTMPADVVSAGER